MPARIRLVRLGKRNKPYYRLVVADREKPRNGRFIEVLGSFDPRAKEKKFVAHKDRIAYWLGCGALPSETVAQLLKRHV